MSNETQNSCVEYIPTKREWLGWKLFPSKHRIRILISGKVILNSKTATGTVIGENATNVAVVSSAA